MKPFRNAMRTAGVAVLASVSIYLSSEIGNLEGRLFPVAVDYAIEGETPAVGVEGVEVTLSFAKVRSCSFEFQEASIPSGMGKWKDAPIYDPKRAGSVFSRPTGHYHVTWLFGFPPSSIGTPIKMVLHHKCWGPTLWETVTEINLPSRL